MQFFIFSIVLLVTLQKEVLSYKVTSIPMDVPSKVGYSPHWDAEYERLLFADQYGQNATICQFDYRTCKTFCATVVVKWEKDSKTACVTKEIFSLNADDSNYMDTATADCTGRLYFGTYGTEICGSTANNSLYSYSPKEGVQEVLTGYKSCFGLAFNADTNKCYFMDTCSYSISELDWCRKTGKLSNSRVIFKFDVAPGAPSYMPFGLCIDSMNNFYSGSYGGGSLLKVKVGGLSGEKGDKCSSVEEIHTPTMLIGCPTFGGPNMTDIFVTSSTLFLDFNTGKSLNENLECTKNTFPQAKEDGSLLKIEQNVLKGVAGTSVSLC
ncbi:Regucalcin [Pseudolycoriella hygida]|uniref:Regucalcin n=1 Tax=Pseudolycoriella hygida TaxID=35572 RepID=A0A9Q0S5J6_9DIPT|nr:Regucalcin [Pseudolycoriella hygida]